MITTSMLHISGDLLDTTVILLGLHAPRTSIVRISSSGHLKLLIYEMLVRKWRISQQGPSSLQLTSSTQRIYLNVFDNPLTVDVGFALPYTAKNLSNSCDNHLSLHF
ncbi:hypothetical protein TNCV_2460541 [Trichonephila clavipes]|nr:hypothetical protein TNCV_2460541 [Trichonephila clavipes]